MKAFAVITLFVMLTGCDSFGAVLADSEYVNKAQAYLDKGKMRAATIELKNALKQNPEDAHARLLLGNLYLDTGNMPGAEKELHKAWEHGTSEELVLPLLARAYLSQGKFDNVQDLPMLQSTASEKARASLLTSKGLASLNQGDTDIASESIAAAIRIKSDLPYALYGQAVVMSTVNEDLEKARNSIDQALEYEPEYAPAWAMLGDLERQANKKETAVLAYSKAIENSPHNISYHLKRATVRIQLQQIDAAQQDIDKLKKRAPNHPGVNYTQGLLSFLQNKYPEAKESFELALRVNDNYMPAVFYLGATNFLLNNEQQARRYLSRFIRAIPYYMPARKILATQEISQGNFQRAEELVRPIVNNANDDVFALNLLANALLGQGKTEEGINILERVSELDPKSAFAKARLGAGLLMHGESSDAIASFETAIELDPKFSPAEILLILNYIQNKEYDQAQGAAQDFIGRQPDNTVAHNLLGKVYMGKELPKQAKAEFTKVIEIAPGDPMASHNLAVLALQDSNPDEARKLYGQVLERHENHLAALLNLAALEAKQGDLEAMKTALERAMSAHPEAVQPRVLLARYYLLSEDSGNASQVLGGLVKKYPNSPIVLGVQAEIETAKKDYRAAKITLERLAERQPNSAQAHYLLSQAYARLNDKVKTEQELARVLELAPGHYFALVALTRLQLQDENFQEAEKNLAILKKLGAGSPDVLAIEAVLRSRSGEKAAALSALEQSFQIKPDTESLLNLARFKWALGKHQEAIEITEQWVAAHPDDVAVRSMLADAYAGKGRSEDTIAQYEHILQISKNNLRALNNLAWYLRKLNPERALSYAEKANALDPESAVIMDTLAALLLDRGELTRAEDLNMRALRKNPDSSTFLFRKAGILEATGKQHDAIAVLKKILENQNTFPERADAEAMLDRLDG